MNRNYNLISDVLFWIVENRHSQPSLADLSRQFHISEFHLQRTFQNKVGISPKQFCKALNKEIAVERLRRGSSVLETSLDIGLSGPGRLHDLLVTTDAVTPGQVRKRGSGLEMEFGGGMTPFGHATVSWTARGISFLGFENAYSSRNAEAELKSQWPDAVIKKDERGAQNLLDQVFSVNDKPDLRVWLRGTPFQVKVWEALLQIPPDSFVSYGQIAKYLGKPAASRAVGSAVGRNPVSWLIPCHRVINSLGGSGGYRWGIATKLALQAYESAQSDFAA
ncbi:MAG: methylated-DNA--[protein]-cysteine S-methyltransferase [Xanthomonadales bacterium]|nr:methylated-DNA--[protein]-cysteine S-methyltransferase [Xanthomonadales bacterium]